MTKQGFLLVIVVGVFMVETLSVIAQVAWFKMTGKRLPRCIPLHNHDLFVGDHEIKIVVRFWISSAPLALIAVASLKIRRSELESSARQKCGNHGFRTLKSF